MPARDSRTGAQPTPRPPAPTAVAGVHRTWVVVADGARARIFEYGVRHEPWVEVACLVNAEGRTIGRDQTTEAPTRVLESSGSLRHAIEPQTSPREKRQERFARALIEALEEGRDRRRYGHLVLVAPPRFLGIMHGLLGKDLRARVAGEVPRNFTMLRAEQIRERVPAWRLH